MSPSQQDPGTLTFDPRWGMNSIHMMGNIQLPNRRQEPTGRSGAPTSESKATAIDPREEGNAGPEPPSPEEVTILGEKAVGQAFAPCEKLALTGDSHPSPAVEVPPTQDPYFTWTPTFNVTTGGDTHLSLGQQKELTDLLWERMDRFRWKELAGSRPPQHLLSIKKSSSTISLQPAEPMRDCRIFSILIKSYRYTGQEFTGADNPELWHRTFPVQAEMWLHYGVKPPPRKKPRGMKTKGEFMEHGILIATNTWEKHQAALQQVLEVSSQREEFFRPEECYFGGKAVDYAYHRISADGLRPSKQFVDEIQQLVFPAVGDSLYAFLGRILQYRKFLPNFTKLTQPLYQGAGGAAGRGAPVIPSTDIVNERFRAFARIREVLEGLPPLGIPEYHSDQPFQMWVTHSARRDGTLTQLKQEQGGKLITLLNLCKRRKKAKFYGENVEREAIQQQLQHWAEYIGNHPTIVMLQHTQTLPLQEEAETFHSQFGLGVIMKAKPIIWWRLAKDTTALPLVSDILTRLRVRFWADPPTVVRVIPTPTTLGKRDSLRKRRLKIQTLQGKALEGEIISLRKKKDKKKTVRSLTKKIKRNKAVKTLQVILPQYPEPAHLMTPGSSKEGRGALLKPIYPRGVKPSQSEVWDSQIRQGLNQAIQIWIPNLSGPIEVRHPLRGPPASSPEIITLVPESKVTGTPDGDTKKDWREIPVGGWDTVLHNSSFTPIERKNRDPAIQCVSMWVRRGYRPPGEILKLGSWELQTYLALWEVLRINTKGELIRIPCDGEKFLKPRLCVGRGYQREVIQRYHQGDDDGPHLSLSRTTEDVTSVAYFPRLVQLIEEVVGQCPECRPRAKPLLPFEGQRSQHYHLGLTGPYPERDRIGSAVGPNYVVTLMDLMTQEITLSIVQPPWKTIAGVNPQIGITAESLVSSIIQALREKKVLGQILTLHGASNLDNFEERILSRIKGRLHLNSEVPATPLIWDPKDEVHHIITRHLQAKACPWQDSIGLIVQILDKVRIPGVEEKVREACRTQVETTVGVGGSETQLSLRDLYPTQEGNSTDTHHKATPSQLYLWGTADMRMNFRLEPYRGHQPVPQPGELSNLYTPRGSPCYSRGTEWTGPWQVLRRVTDRLWKIVPFPRRPDGLSLVVASSRLASSRDYNNGWEKYLSDSSPAPSRVRPCPSPGTDDWATLLLNDEFLEGNLEWQVRGSNLYTDRQLEQLARQIGPTDPDPQTEGSLAPIAEPGVTPEEWGPEPPPPYSPGNWELEEDPIDLSIPKMNLELGTHSGPTVTRARGTTSPRTAMVITESSEGQLKLKEGLPLIHHFPPETEGLPRLLSVHRFPPNEKAGPPLQSKPLTPNAVVTRAQAKKQTVTPGEVRKRECPPGTSLQVPKGKKQKALKAPQEEEVVMIRLRRHPQGKHAGGWEVNVKQSPSPKAPHSRGPGDFKRARATLSGNV